VGSVPPPLPSGDAHTAFLWYDVELLDSSGSPLPLDIQCWVRNHGTATPTWGAPVLEPTGAIRATIPHSYGHVTFPYDVVANGVVCLDMNSQSPSQGPTGACNTAPAGWPTNQPAHQGQAGCTAVAPAYLTSGVVALARDACRNAFGTWCYAADPLGFDQKGPAKEYVAGWDWVDQALDGAADPTETGFWYESTHWGRRLPRFNYGEYGMEVAFTIRSPEPSRRFRVGLTQAYAIHSIPWAWYDETAGKAGAVPWHLIAGGYLSDRNQYLVADGETEWTFVTTLTAGAWAPLRLILQPASG